MDERLQGSIDYALKRNGQYDAEREIEKRNRKLLPCVIYFIQAGEYTKVGITRQLKKRMDHIQGACPFEIVLLKALKTDKPFEDEREFHTALAEFHVRGEWFKIPSNHSIMLLIKG